MRGQWLAPVAFASLVKPARVRRPQTLASDPRVLMAPRRCRAAFQIPDETTWRRLAGSYPPAHISPCRPPLVDRILAAGGHSGDSVESGLCGSCAEPEFGTR